MNEEYILQVLEIRQLDDQWEIRGLVFGNVEEGDLLSIRKSNEIDQYTLHIREISAYGYPIERLERGDKGNFVVQSDSEIDLRRTKYLYKVNTE